MRRAGRNGTMLAAAAAAILLAAGLLGYGIANRAAPPANEAAIPAPATHGTATPVPFPLYDRPRALPEIRFADEHGRDLTLADFRGRVVLLNIWATWCVPCRKEMPALDRLQAKLGGSGFAVVPLSIDREGVAPVKRFYREVGVKSLAVYIDPSGKGSHGVAVPGVPTSLLIDRDGREIARKMGAADWDGPEMVSLLKRIIGESGTGEGTGNR